MDSVWILGSFLLVSVLLVSFKSLAAAVAATAVDACCQLNLQINFFFTLLVSFESLGAAVAATAIEIEKTPSTRKSRSEFCEKS